MIQIVLCVGQHSANVHLLTVVVNGSDQPEFVASKIEDRQFPHHINATERRFQIGKAAKLPRFSETIPILEGFPSLWVQFQKQQQLLARDDVNLGHHQARRLENFEHRNFLAIGLKLAARAFRVDLLGQRRYFARDAVEAALFKKRLLVRPRE